MKLIIPLIVVFFVLVTLGFAKSKKKEVWETTPGGPYELIITESEIACEHPKRARESIRWDEITEIILVTTDEGPVLPDMWFIFVGDNKKGCSVPTEAKGFRAIWSEFQNRFQGLDLQAIAEAGTDNSKRTIWKKSNKTINSDPKSRL